MHSTSLMFGFVSALVLAGCGQEKKMEPVPVGEMEVYRDPGFRYEISHPKGWENNLEVGRARFYNAPEVQKKFLDPTGAYPIGVEISVDVIKTPDPQARIKQMKDEMTANNFQLKQEERVTVGGMTGVRFGYAANYGNKNIIYGHHVLLPGDSLLYDFGFAGFGDYYDAYKTTFDAVLNSFKAPKPIEKGRDETLPAESYSPSDNKFFSFQYPDNFNFANPPKSKNDLVVILRGARGDCGIQFDVFGAQGLTVAKVFDQNKGKFRGATFSDATISGQPAKTLTYSATKDVERRIYFVVKSDKVIRITMDWYKPQRADYLAAYEKVVASVKLK